MDHDLTDAIKEHGREVPVCAPGERHDPRGEAQPRGGRHPVGREREDGADDLAGRGVEQVPAARRALVEHFHRRDNENDVDVRRRSLRGACGLRNDSGVGASSWSNSPACFDMGAGPERPLGLVFVEPGKLSRQDGGELR